VKPLTESDIRSSFVNATPEELDHLPIPGLHEMLWTTALDVSWWDRE